MNADILTSTIIHNESKVGDELELQTSTQNVKHRRTPRIKAKSLFMYFFKALFMHIIFDPQPALLRKE